jgi:hypothetical protein
MGTAAERKAKEELDELETKLGNPENSASPAASCHCRC